MEWTEFNGGIDLGGSSEYVITNNIVASTWHHGFKLPAYKCGETPIHTGNVAHSISGFGLIVHEGAGSCS